ncbi:hypothetical protein ACOGYP_001825 [Edwardsiella piscicida]|nr:hypothetical protein [Edwardsiella piscicida]
MFTKNDKKEIIESLSRFRNASDKLSDDIFNLSSKILAVLENIPHSDQRSPELESVAHQLNEMVSDVLQSTLDANTYSQSLFKDYTKAVKKISAVKEISDVD